LSWTVIPDAKYSSITRGVQVNLLAMKFCHNNKSKVF